MKDEKSKSCQKDMQQREKFRRLIYSFSGMEGNSFSANSIHVIDNIIIIPFVIYIKNRKTEERFQLLGKILKNGESLILLASTCRREEFSN